MAGARAATTGQGEVEASSHHSLEFSSRVLYLVPEDWQLQVRRSTAEACCSKMASRQTDVSLDVEEEKQHEENFTDYR